LEQGRDIVVVQVVEVRDAITLDVDTVTADLSLAELEQAFAESHHHGFPVVDEHGELCSIVTIQDLERASEKGDLNAMCVRDIASPAPLAVFPDELVVTLSNCSLL
jgi:chloride channel protein, CIC family